MQESSKKRNRILSASAAVLLAVAFLAASHRAWLQRKVVVSFDLEFAKPSVCQLFYTDSRDLGFWPEQSETAYVKPGGTRAEFVLPVDRLEKIRVDFGNAPGLIRAGSVTVAGSNVRMLDWRNFTIRHDIGSFDVGPDGSVDVIATGGDPYAACPEPVGVEGHWKVRPGRLALFAALLGFAAIGRGFLVSFKREISEKLVFCVFAFGLVVFRAWFSSTIPPYFGASSWDDAWVVNEASFLLRGEWMGLYDDHTLIKGFFGPSVLAASKACGIPFLWSETVLHVAGCVFFLWIMLRFVHNRTFLLFAFAFLLFDPLSFSQDTFQRIYRNGMVLWQLPLAYGGLFMMFRRSREPIQRLAPWALLSGFSLWVFANTREDGIWLVPFVLAAVSLSCIRAWAAGSDRRDRIVRVAACLLPAAILLAGNGILCAVNWRLYGLPLRNDRDAGNYARVVRDLYLIAPDPIDEARLSGPDHSGHYHNIGYSTICKAYDASPALASVRPQLDAAFDAWNAAEGHPGRDLVADHVLFALRKGVAAAGFYESLPSSEEFYETVHRELSGAFATGKLARRRGFSFTPMAAPFRVEFASPAFREWGTALYQTVKFGLARTVLNESGTTIAPGAVPLFERISGNMMPRKDEMAALRPCIDRANCLTASYSDTMPWFFLLAVAGYIVEAVLLFRRSPRMAELLDGWLLATGLLGSILVQTACIGYINATTFFSMYYMYLAPSILSAMLFVVLVAGLGVAAAKPVRSGKRKENT